MFSCSTYYSISGDKLYPCLVLILVYFLMPSVYPFSFTRKPVQPMIVVLNSNSTNVDLRWYFSLASGDIFSNINLKRYEQDKGLASLVVLGFYQVGYTNVNTTLYNFRTDVTNGPSSGYVNFTIKDIRKQTNNKDGSKADPRSIQYIYRLEMKMANILNPAVSDVELMVLYPPKILAPPTNQTVVESSSVSQTCYLEGKPVSNVTWFKDGIPIIPANDNIISVSPPTSVSNASATISITNVNRTEEGSYSCQAVNDVGRVMSSAGLLKVNYPPKILVSPTSQTVVESSSVSLTCYLEGKPVSTVTWFKDGDPIIPANDNRISVSSPTSVSNTGATMIITNVNRTDEGNYSCQAVNDVGNDTSSAALLTVNYPPKILVPPASQTVVERSCVSLTCYLEGKPVSNVTWFKDGNPIIPAIDNIIFVFPPTSASNTNATMTITNVNRTNEGSYSCQAVNDVGNDTSSAALLRVNYGVNIFVHPKAQTKNEGESVTLTCEVEGKPAPVVTWFKNGNPLTVEMSRMNVTQPTTHNRTAISLTISDLKRTDEASYSCNVNNSYGEQNSGAALLTVNYPPKVLVSALSQTVVESSSVSLTCYLEGKPVSTVSWFKDGIPVISVNDSRISVSSPTSVSNTSATMNITNVNRTDEGSYSCQAVNDVGNDTSSAAFLTVNYEPELTTIDAFPKGEVFCTGQHIHIYCRSDSNPPTKYSLYHNNKVVRSGSTNGSFDVVLNTTGNNNYTCVPDNAVGFGQHESLQLVVKEPPEIKKCSKSMTNRAVIEGNQVNITCIISGSEPLNVTWTNGKQVWNERILKFQPVSRNDAGTYNIDVRASDEGGCNNTAKANVTFDVYYLDEPKVIGSNNKSYSPSNPEVWFNISVTAYPNEVVLSCETSTLDISTVISSYDHSRINIKTFIVFVIITLPVESANITCHAKRGHQAQREKTLFVYKPANSSFDFELLQKKGSGTKAITTDIVLGTLFALSLLLNVLLVVGFVWFRRKESRDKLLKRSETNKGSGGHLNQMSLQDEGSNSSNQQTFELSNVVPEYETVTPRRRQPQPSYAPVIKKNEPNRQRQISHQERQRNPTYELPNNQPPIYQNIQTQPRIYSPLSPLTHLPSKNTTSQTGEYQALQKKSAPQHYQSLDVNSKC